MYGQKQKNRPRPKHGTKDSFRDTTQIDRFRSTLIKILTRSTCGSTCGKYTVFFRRLRSVFHIRFTAVLHQPTALCERASRYSLHHSIYPPYIIASFWHDVKSFFAKKSADVGVKNATPRYIRYGVKLFTKL